jgi:hypothetical protein
MRAEALLRQALARAGVDVAANVNMNVAKCLHDRGVKGLKFNPAFEFQDPFGTQEVLTPPRSLGNQEVAHEMGDDRPRDSLHGLVVTPFPLGADD